MLEALEQVGQYEPDYGSTAEEDLLRMREIIVIAAPQQALGNSSCARTTQPMTLSVAVRLWPKLCASPGMESMLLSPVLPTWETRKRSRRHSARLHGVCETRPDVHGV
jgi:hypothetical protein